jgi:PPOX class probable F420-dependent enzyme
VRLLAWLSLTAWIAMGAQRAPAGRSSPLPLAEVTPESPRSAPTENPHPASVILAAAREIMKTARYCSLVTLDAAGQPQARIVDPFPPEDKLAIWIATNPATRKVREIRADPRVSLIYFDPKGPAYVTVIATAEVVEDPAEKARRWKEDWARFYVDRNRGSDYVLIRVKPTRLEVVSEAHGLINDPKTWRPPAVDLEPISR